MNIRFQRLVSTLFILQLDAAFFSLAAASVYNSPPSTISESVDSPPLCMPLRRTVVGKRIPVPLLWLVVCVTVFFCPHGMAFGRMATLLR